MEPVELGGRRRNQPEDSDGGSGSLKGKGERQVEDSPTLMEGAERVIREVGEKKAGHSQREPTNNNIRKKEKSNSRGGGLYLFGRPAISGGAGKMGDGVIFVQGGVDLESDRRLLGTSTPKRGPISAFAYGKIRGGEKLGEKGSRKHKNGGGRRDSVKTTAAQPGPVHRQKRYKGHAGGVGVPHG